ncbi:MAG TPA: hypothetical protein VNJ51_10870 [Candidatus Dormibacteraeota bacterium]|nr:hypothetical protein [Candidatus Dormibacteraeota bacterium]
MRAAPFLIPAVTIAAAWAAVSVAFDVHLGGDALTVRLGRLLTVYRVPYASIQSVDVVSAWKGSWEPRVNFATRLWGSILMVRHSGGVFHLLRISPPDVEAFAAELRLRAAAAAETGS